MLDAEPAWFCEWDDAPSKILANHWPDVPNYRDVTTVDWAAIPPVDIIAGGSPCQDLSLAGARRGMTDGTRSNLWVAMREAIATIRPRLVVWENVRGALSATATSESDMEPGAGLLGGGGGHLRALGRVLGDLASIGYDAQWQLLRASDVGAPHHRARVFLVAYPADAGSVGLQAARRGSGSSASLAGSVGGSGTLSALSHLPTPNASDGSGGGQPMSLRAGNSRQLIDAALDLPHLPTPTIGDKGGTDAHSGKGYGPPLSEVVRRYLHEDQRDRYAPYLPTPNASDGTGGGQTPDKRTGHSRQMIDAVLNLEGQPYLPTPVAQPSGNTPEDHLRKKPGRKVATDLAVIAENGLMATGGRLDGERCDTSVFGKYEPVVHRWEAVTGMTAPAPTELNRNGKPRLNAAFAEWMMGLPPGWVTDVPGVTRAQQLKACGNGVVPQQAAAALAYLIGGDVPA